MEELVEAALESAPSDRERRELGDDRRPAESTIGVIGIGGAGLGCVNTVSRSGSDVTTVALDCDRQALSMIEADVKVFVSDLQDQWPKDGEEGELTASAVETIHETCSDALSGTSLCLLVPGQGWTGRTLYDPTMSVLDALELSVVTTAVLPFSFEGRRRTQAVETAVSGAERGDGLVIVDNDVVGSVDSTTPIGSALMAPFKHLERLCSAAVRSEPDAPGALSTDKLRSVLTDHQAVAIASDRVRTPVHSGRFVASLFDRASANVDPKTVECLHLDIRGPPGLTSEDGDLLLKAVETWFESEFDRAPTLFWSGRRDESLESELDMVGCITGGGTEYNGGE